MTASKIIHSLGQCMEKIYLILSDMYSSSKLKLNNYNIYYNIYIIIYIYFYSYLSRSACAAVLIL